MNLIDVYKSLQKVLLEVNSLAQLRVELYLKKSELECLQSFESIDVYQDVVVLYDLLCLWQTLYLELTDEGKNIFLDYIERYKISLLSKLEVILCQEQNQYHQK